MNIKSYAAAAALCMLPMLSQAGIIYEWRALNNEAPRGLTFRLEFEKKTVKSGAFNFHLEEDEMQYGWPRRKLGLITYQFSFPGGGGQHFHRDYGYEKNFGYNVGNFHMDVDFDRNGFMHGFISTSNFETAFSMWSEKGVFIVHDLKSDAPTDWAGCDWYANTPCGGAMGEIRRVEVPEPTSIALLALGVAGLATTRRRKVQRT